MQPKQNLKQMVSLLEGERQALAALDLERILTCAQGKSALCDELARYQPEHLDDECRGLLDAARRLNAINRKLRNLIADNVQSRLGMLTGGGIAYSPAPAMA